MTSVLKGTDIINSLGSKKPQHFKKCILLCYNANDVFQTSTSSFPFPHRTENICEIYNNILTVEINVKVNFQRLQRQQIWGIKWYLGLRKTLSGKVCNYCWNKEYISLKWDQFLLLLNSLYLLLKPRTKQKRKTKVTRYAIYSHMAFSFHKQEVRKTLKFIIFAISVGVFFKISKWQDPTMYYKETSGNLIN